jgi:hypothetical protein
LPDIAVAKQFKKRGWLIAKTRAHDICPDCLKGRMNVEEKNHLAGVFKVTDENGPVPSAAELADEFKTEAARKRKQTMGILDRHFGGSSPSDHSLVPAPADRKVAHDEQTFKAVVANDIQEIRAAVELIAGQNRRQAAGRSNRGQAPRYDSR